MSFLTPWLLGGLGAVLAPILLHLLQRRQVVRVPFSSLKFLRKIAAKTSRRSRMENLLLLLMRCLVIILLVLAAARPVMAPQAGIWWGEAPKTMVLIVDHSLSMNYRSGERSRLDRAKEQAAIIIDRLRPGDEVAVLASSDRVDALIAEPTLDHAAARQVLEEIQPTQRRTDFSSALQEATEIASRSARADKEIFLLTDSQATGWAFNHDRVFGEPWQEAGAQLVVARPDERTASNLAITAVELSAPYATAGARVDGTVVVRNFSSHPAADLVEVSLDGEQVLRTSIDIEPDGAARIPFEFQAPVELDRSLRGEARLQGDALSDDDTFAFLLPIVAAPSILIVEGLQVGAEKVHSGFFLARALAAAARGTYAEDDPLAIDRIGVGEIPETNLAEYTGVYLLDPGALSDRAAVALEQYAENGGTLVFFFGDNTTPTETAGLELLPGRPLTVETLPPGRSPAIMRDREHSLFAGFWTGQTAFPSLPQKKAFTWELDDDATVVMTLGDEIPFILERPLGSGKVLAINASADRSWGELPLSPVFVPLTQRVARWTAEQARGAARFHIGDTPPVPPAFRGAGQLRMTLPDGRLEPLPGAMEAGYLPTLRQQGLHRLESADGAVGEYFVVNIPSEESDLTPMDPAELRPLVNPSDVAGLEELRFWLDEARGRTPLWPLLLVLAALVYAAETLMSNILAKRRAQSFEQKIATGRLNKRRQGSPFRAGATKEEAVA